MLFIQLRSFTRNISPLCHYYQLADHSFFFLLFDGGIEVEDLGSGT